MRERKEDISLEEKMRKADEIFANGHANTTLANSALYADPLCRRAGFRREWASFPYWEEADAPTKEDKETFRDIDCWKMWHVRVKDLPEGVFEVRDGDTEEVYSPKDARIQDWWVCTDGDGNVTDEVPTIVSSRLYSGSDCRPWKEARR